MCVIYTCNPGGIVFFSVQQVVKDFINPVDDQLKLQFQIQWQAVRLQTADVSVALQCGKGIQKDEKRERERERERKEAMVVVVAGVRQNKRTALP
jgi:hypothetical protein